MEYGKPNDIKDMDIHENNFEKLNEHLVQLKNELIGNGIQSGKRKQNMDCLERRIKIHEIRQNCKEKEGILSDLRELSILLKEQGCDFSYEELTAKESLDKILVTMSREQFKVAVQVYRAHLNSMKPFENIVKALLKEIKKDFPKKFPRKLKMKLIGCTNVFSKDTREMTLEDYVSTYKKAIDEIGTSLEEFERDSKNLKKSKLEPLRRGLIRSYARLGQLEKVDELIGRYDALKETRGSWLFTRRYKSSETEGDIAIFNDWDDKHGNERVQLKNWLDKDTLQEKNKQADDICYSLADHYFEEGNIEAGIEFIKIPFLTDADDSVSKGFKDKMKDIVNGYKNRRQYSKAILLIDRFFEAESDSLKGGIPILAEKDLGAMLCDEKLSLSRKHYLTVDGKVHRRECSPGYMEDIQYALLPKGITQQYDPLEEAKNFLGQLVISRDESRFTHEFLKLDPDTKQKFVDKVRPKVGLPVPCLSTELQDYNENLEARTNYDNKFLEVIKANGEQFLSEIVKEYVNEDKFDLALKLLSKLKMDGHYIVHMGTHDLLINKEHEKLLAYLGIFEEINRPRSIAGMDKLRDLLQIYKGIQALSTRDSKLERDVHLCITQIVNNVDPRDLDTASDLVKKLTDIRLRGILARTLITKYEQSNKLGRAKELIAQLIRNDPENNGFIADIARKYINADDLDTASDLVKMMTDIPSRENFARTLITKYIESNKLDRAMELIKYLGRNDQGPYIDEIAKKYIAANELDAASDLVKMMTDIPSRDNVARTLITKYIESNKLDRAVELIKYLGRNDQGPYIDEIAKKYIAADKLDAASDLVKKLPDIPLREESYRSLVFQYQSVGDFEAAFTCIKERLTDTETNKGFVTDFAKKYVENKISKAKGSVKDLDEVGKSQGPVNGLSAVFELLKTLDPAKQLHEGLCKAFKTELTKRFKEPGVSDKTTEWIQYLKESDQADEDFILEVATKFIEEKKDRVKALKLAEHLSGDKKNKFYRLLPPKESISELLKEGEMGGGSWEAAVISKHGDVFNKQFLERWADTKYWKELRKYNKKYNEYIDSRSRGCYNIQEPPKPAHTMIDPNTDEVIPKDALLTHKTLNDAVDAMNMIFKNWEGQSEDDKEKFLRHIEGKLAVEKPEGPNDSKEEYDKAFLAEINNISKLPDKGKKILEELEILDRD